MLVRNIWLPISNWYIISTLTVQSEKFKNFIKQVHLLNYRYIVSLKKRKLMQQTQYARGNTGENKAVIQVQVKVPL